MKKITLLVFLCIKFYCCFSNPLIQSDTNSFKIARGTNILYYVENSSGNNNEYLIPLVESELKSMTDKSDSLLRRIFKSVQSLNYIIAGDQANGTLRSITSIFNKGTIDWKDNKNLDREDSLTVRQLQNNDYFLKININTLNTLLEFQFVLFKLGKGGTEAQDNLMSRNYRASSVFIDPTLSNYKDKIRVALRQVVKEANEPPISTIIFKKKRIVDSIYVTKGLLTLTGEATDDDSSPDQITFNWKFYKSETPVLSSNTITISGRQFDAYVNDSGKYDLTLTVSDGITETKRKAVIVVTEPPVVRIIYPVKVLNIDFYNNTYYLYSYHNNFNANDFSTFWTIGKTNLKNYFDGGDDWSLLVPNLNILSNVPNSKDIKISTIQFKNVNDTISNYRERPLESMLVLDSGLKINYQILPFLKKLNSQTSNDVIYLPLTAEQTEGTSVFNYSIYQNKNETGRVKIPSTETFKVTAIDHDIQNSEMFQIKFHKVSRISPFLEETVLFSNIFDKSIKDLHFGAGIEYIVTPQISVSGCAGIQTPFVSGNNTYVDDTYYYKLNLNLALVNYRDALKGFLILSDIRRPSYWVHPNYLRATPYHSRPGVGFSLQPTFDRNGFPATADLFFMYFVSNDDLYKNFCEIGIKLKLYLIK